jgi:uncharacterized Zn finger protein
LEISAICDHANEGVEEFIIREMTGGFEVLYHTLCYPAKCESSRVYIAREELQPQVDKMLNSLPTHEFTEWGLDGVTYSVSINRDGHTRTFCWWGDGGEDYRGLMGFVSSIGALMTIKKAKSTTGTWLNEDTLMDMAWDRSYERGVDYFQAGAVDDLSYSRGWAIAQVIGSDTYQVRLRVDGMTPEWQCDCPVGEDGLFCKHCVAVGLAWLVRVDKGEVETDSAETLRSYLEQQDKNALIEWLIEAAENHPELRQRLMVENTTAAPQLDIKHVKQQIRQALSVRGFIDYRGMRRFVTRARPVVHILEGLIAQGRSAEALPLLQYALEVGLKNLEKTDDSDGGFGDLLSGLAEAHHTAAMQARPNSKKFAKDFFKLRMLDGWNFFSLDAYEPVLGEDGLAVYRKLVQHEWDKVLPKKAGKDEGSYFGEHFTIRTRMEELAERDQDIDALVAIKARDLSQVYAYSDIAEILFNAKRIEEAIGWAERGYKAFPNERKHSLVDFLIKAYHEVKRHKDAEQLAWKEFSATPSLNSYQTLKQSAGKNKNWPACRKKARSLLDKVVKDEASNKTKSSRYAFMPRSTRGVLLEILLWENQIDEAVTQMKTHGCPRYLTMKMAQACEKSHKTESINLYKNEIQLLVDRRNNDSYAQAAKLVEKVGKLYQQLKQKAAFEGYVSDLRKEHKAKRNFMECLDGVL